MAGFGSSGRVGGRGPAAPSGDPAGEPFEDRPELLPDEMRALARLGFDELRRLNGGIGDVHRAVSERVFAAVGRPGALVRMAHKSITGGVYAGVGGGFSIVGRVADEALGRRAPRVPRPLSPTAWGGGVLGVIDG